MFDLELTVDEAMPSHVVYLSLAIDGRTLHVTASPRIDPKLLAALNPQIGDAVAVSIDELPSQA